MEAAENQIRLVSSSDCFSTSYSTSSCNPNSVESPKYISIRRYTMDHETDINLETNAAQVTSQQQSEYIDLIGTDDTSTEIDVFTKVQESLPNQSPSIASSPFLQYLKNDHINANQMLELVMEVTSIRFIPAVCNAFDATRSTTDTFDTSRAILWLVEDDNCEIEKQFYFSMISSLSPQLQED